jgi:hypothetical protein
MKIKNVYNTHSITPRHHSQIKVPQEPQYPGEVQGKSETNAPQTKHSHYQPKTKVVDAA